MIKIRGKKSKVFPLQNGECNVRILFHTKVVIVLATINLNMNKVDIQTSIVE